jgi:MoxR-like ATPase
MEQEHTYENAAGPKPGNEVTPAEIARIYDLYEKARREIAKVIVGNDELIRLILSAMFSGGHVLIEGVPGVAKTLMAKLVAQCMNISFKRVQFTPDLLPADLIGVPLFNMQKSEFIFKKGPIFANLVLIDEINRSPAKTQAALFEAMEEKQVTVDGVTHPLDPPFFVMATQNPIEQEGTYKLPEAQLDRFLMRIEAGYPDLQSEIGILERFKSDFTLRLSDEVKPVIESFDLKESMSIVERVHIGKELISYIASIVHNTRNNGNLFLGASPRASLAIMKTSKAMAALQGREFVTPDDVRTVCFPVLNHRVILTPEKEMEGVTVKKVITDLLQSIEVPR